MGFKEYPDTNASSIKKQVNKWLCEILLPYDLGNSWENGKFVLLLDAVSFQSTKALLEYGIVPDAKYIVIPNPFEFNAMDEEIKKQDILNGVQLKREYSGKVLSESESNSFKIVYLDYTCTLSGCKRVRPKSELTKAFQNQIFDYTSSFLALTLHLPRVYGDDIQKGVQEAVDFLNNITEEANIYHPNLIFHRVYNNVSSRMIFFVFNLTNSQPK